MTPNRRPTTLDRRTQTDLRTDPPSATSDAATIALDVPSVGAQPQLAPRTDPPSDHRPVLAHFDL